MSSTIDLKVCPSCNFASEAAGNFCSNCGQAFASSTNSKFHDFGNEFRDEYGWQKGAPPGDPRFSSENESFWGSHRVIEDNLSDGSDFLTTLAGLAIVGCAVYGLYRFLDNDSGEDKKLTNGS